MARTVGPRTSTSVSYSLRTLVVLANLRDRLKQGLPIEKKNEEDRSLTDDDWVTFALIKHWSHLMQVFDAKRGHVEDGWAKARPRTVRYIGGIGPPLRCLTWGRRGILRWGGCQGVW